MNEWERRAGEVGVTFSSGAEQAELLRASVRGAGTHAALENTEAIAHLSLTAPEYRVGGCSLGQVTRYWCISRRCPRQCSTLAKSRSGLTITAGSSPKVQSGKRK